MSSQPDWTFTRGLERLVAAILRHRKEACSGMSYWPYRCPRGPISSQGGLLFNHLNQIGRVSTFWKARGDFSNHQG